jgi:hypothetical protein
LEPLAFFALGFDGGVERVPASDLASEARGSARVSSVHRFELVDQRRCPATIRRDKGEESLAEIGRSYNVSGWTIGRLAP